MTYNLTTLLVRAKVTAVSRLEAGATAAEYALMVSFIAIAIILAVITFGAKLSSFFNEASIKV